jgi:hypothetical protein
VRCTVGSVAALLVIVSPTASMSTQGEMHQPQPGLEKRKRTKQEGDRRQPALLLPLTGARKGKQRPSVDPAVASIKKRSRGA